MNWQSLASTRAMGMKCLLRFGVTALASLLLQPSASGQEPIKVRVYGGYGTIGMRDMNSVIEQTNELLELSGFRQRIQSIKGGLVFGGDLILPETRQVSLVFSYDRVSSSIDSRIVAADGILRNEITVEADFVQGGLLVRLRPDGPFYVIFKGGVGYGNSVQELRVTVEPIVGDGLDVDAGHSANGSGFVAEVGLGGNLRFSPESTLFGFVEASYRYRNLRSFDGKSWLNDDESRGDIMDVTGNVVEFDYSGLAIKVGLGVSL